jgi:hypothetical protein
LEPHHHPKDDDGRPFLLKRTHAGPSIIKMMDEGLWLQVDSAFYRLVTEQIP